MSINDPDISVTYISKNYGRNKIKISYSVEEFLNNPLEIIRNSMNYIISKHNQNVNEFKYLLNYFKGQQDIEDKTRPNGDGKINNKHVTNYAWEYVNFKVGYYVGKPIKYVNAVEDTDDAIRYLNMYNRCIAKNSKDLIKYQNLMITGLAHTMVIPSKTYDTEYTSPYNYIILPNENVCVVRANDVFETQLFSVVFAKDSVDSTTYSKYTIYFNNKVIVLDQDLNLIQEGNFFVEQPITEYQLNEQRMGVFEPIIESLNSLNKIRSNQIDYMQETIDSYITFKNVDIDTMLEKIDEMRKKRMLAVNTNNPEAPADIGSIKIEGDISTSNDTYNDIEQRTYDIVGVPMPTSSTGQGVSGEAQVYGGGWENAQTIANVDTNYIMQFEMEDLSKMLFISKDAINSKTSSLNPFNIEIKYTINKSNNMLVKSQTFKYLRDLGVPFEEAYEISELTDDPYTLAKVSEEYYRKEQEEKVRLEVEKEKQLNSMAKENVDNEQE